MSDDLTQKDHEMLARCLERFKTRVALIRMGIPTIKPSKPYCTCAFIDDDGTYYPAEPAGCEIHPKLTR
jgi:hypothetical protein